MKTSHTPGPWVLDENNHVYTGGYPTYTALKGDSGNWKPIRNGLIALPYSPGSGSHEANARLIAAAPDLLAALKDILSEADFGDSELEKKARAAIAKAEGSK